MRGMYGIIGGMNGIKWIAIAIICHISGNFPCFFIENRKRIQEICVNTNIEYNEKVLLIKIIKTYNKLL